MKTAHNFVDLSGRVFGRLTVIQLAPATPCKRTKWICRCSCGKETAVHAYCLKSGDTKSCGCLRKESNSRYKTGALHPLWKNGKCNGSDGYVRFSHGPNKGMLEHRFIMEQYLGRKLLLPETVHHRNGIRDDNRLENLELWASNHSDGQRVEELVSWAESILKIYKPEPNYVSMLSAC